MGDVDDLLDYEREESADEGGGSGQDSSGSAGGRESSVSTGNSAGGDALGTSVEDRDPGHPSPGTTAPSVPAAAVSAVATSAGGLSPAFEDAGHNVSPSAAAADTSSPASAAGVSAQDLLAENAALRARLARFQEPVDHAEATTRDARRRTEHEPREQVARKGRGRQDPTSKRRAQERADEDHKIAVRRAREDAALRAAEEERAVSERARNQRAQQEQQRLAAEEQQRAAAQVQDAEAAVASAAAALKAATEKAEQAKRQKQLADAEASRSPPTPPSADVDLTDRTAAAGRSRSTSPVSPALLKAFEPGNREYRFRTSDTAFLNLALDSTTLERITWRHATDGLKAWYTVLSYVQRDPSPASTFNDYMSSDVLAAMPAKLADDFLSLLANLREADIAPPQRLVVGATQRRHGRDTSSSSGAGTGFSRDRRDQRDGSFSDSHNTRNRRNTYRQDRNVDRDDQEQRGSRRKKSRTQDSARTDNSRGRGRSVSRLRRPSPDNDGALPTHR
eukprot:g15186.t1